MSGANLLGAVGRSLQQRMLSTRNVYILDTHLDLFVWIGRRSQRLVRTAALRLAMEMMTLLRRPRQAQVVRVLELAEPQLFKAFFTGWDDVIEVSGHGPRQQQRLGC